MVKTSRERIKEARRFFFKNNQKRNIIYKGDKRVLGNRLCSLCSERLTKVMSNGKGVCVLDHYVMDMEIYTVYFCKDSRICNRNTEG